MKYLCAVSACVLLSLPLGAQQRLSDVAGSITIDKDVVIDDSEIARAPVQRASAPLSLSDDLRAARVELDGVVAAIDALIAEVVSGREIYDPGWQSRMVDAAESLELEASAIDSIGVSAGQDAAFGLALEATTALRAASDVMRATIHSRSASIQAHNQHLREGRRLLDEAIRAAARAERSAALAQPPPAIRTMDALAAAQVLCASRAAEGSAELKRCEAGQREAIVALEGRSRVQLGVEEVAFNRLRNSCLTQWPDDFARRNECELRKAAEITGTSE